MQEKKCPVLNNKDNMFVTDPRSGVFFCLFSYWCCFFSPGYFADIILGSCSHITWYNFPSAESERSHPEVSYPPCQKTKRKKKRFRKRKEKKGGNRENFWAGKIENSTFWSDSKPQRLNWELLSYSSSPSLSLSPLLLTRTRCSTPGLYESLEANFFALGGTRSRWNSDGTFPHALAKRRRHCGCKYVGYINGLLQLLGVRLPAPQRPRWRTTAFQDLLSCGQRPRSQPPGSLTSTHRPAARHSQLLPPITGRALPTRQRRHRLRLGRGRAAIGRRESRGPMTPRTLCPSTNEEARWRDAGLGE